MSLIHSRDGPNLTPYEMFLSYETNLNMTCNITVRTLKALPFTLNIF